MKRTKRVALAGMLSALIVALMFAISLVEMLDLTASALGGLIVSVALIELGTLYSVGVYAVSGILSVLLLPNKLCAIIFVAFAGLYPILKQYIEKIKPGALAWVVKGVLLAALIALTVYFKLFGDIEWYLYIFGVFAFAVYDLTLYVFALFYIQKIQTKIKR